MADHPAERYWVLTVHELPDGRLVLGGEIPPDRAAFLARLAAAVEREAAGDALGLPGLCQAALERDR